MALKPLRILFAQAETFRFSKSRRLRPFAGGRFKLPTDASLLAVIYYLRVFALPPGTRSCGATNQSSSVAGLDSIGQWHLVKFYMGLHLSPLSIFPCHVSARGIARNKGIIRSHYAQRSSQGYNKIARRPTQRWIQNRRTTIAE